MTLKKLKLKVKNHLSDEEMKQISGGSTNGSTYCNANSSITECWNSYCFAGGQLRNCEYYLTETVEFPPYYPWVIHRPKWLCVCYG